MKLQNKFLSDIDKCETRIKESQELIDGIAIRKEAIIKSYLMDDDAQKSVSKEIKGQELSLAAEPEVSYKKKK